MQFANALKTERQPLKAQWNTNTHALELTLGTCGEMLNVYFWKSNKHCNIAL